MILYDIVSSDCPLFGILLYYLLTIKTVTKDVTSGSPHSDLTIDLILPNMSNTSL